jgi:hypothetical protein
MVAGTHIDGPTVSISGEIIQTVMPCGDEEPCANCLTPALSANEDIYYFSTTDPVVERQLDSIMSELVSVNCICVQPAVVTGVLYMRGGFHYIAISSITVLGDIQPKKKDKLPSLCDEWNVLEISNVTCGYCEEYRTYNFHLTTDTVIGGLLYSQLIKDGAYKGALREGNNRDIYCVPAGCSQEYLLYAFNAQVGDSLKNIWVGGYSSWIPDVRSVIVSEIKQTTPRTIELEVHYYEAPDAYEESIGNLTWIEGIGMPFGPMGAECSVFNGCADSKAKLLLCAYKNGEHIYTSDFGEQYGCEYNYDPYLTPDDTIPLYIKDNPGTSTVDPADPNLIYAVLRNDMLIIRDFTGVEIFLTLSRNGSLFGPRRARSVQAQQSFTDSTSVELTEEGTYDIELTSESWNYIVVGSFDFNKTHEAVEIIPSERPAASKILRNGQLLIRIGDQLYTPSGVMVQ